jgi:Amt family ammonium transporter
MKLRLPDEVLATGDLGVHGEEAYPDETLVMGRPVEPPWPARAERVGSKPAEPPDD